MYAKIFSIISKLMVLHYVSIAKKEGFSSSFRRGEAVTDR